MKMNVLVAYATAHGSTKEIAQRIADRLAPQVAPGKVDILPMESVPVLNTSPTLYHAAVLGSAVHAGRWLGTARTFLDTNAGFLSGTPTKSGAAEGTTRTAIPTWAFTVGMPASDDDLAKEETAVGDKIRKQLPQLRDHKLFRGVFEKEDLNWFFKFIINHVVPENKQRVGDHRDWQAIESWADKVGKAITESDAD